MNSTVCNADCIPFSILGTVAQQNSASTTNCVKNGYYTGLYNKQLLEEKLAEV